MGLGTGLRTLVDVWSVPRRALARICEITGVGAIADAAGWLPQFNEVALGKHVVFYALSCMAASMIYDIFEIALRPDIWPPPCVDPEPKLPFEEGK